MWYGKLVTRGCLLAVLALLGFALAGEPPAEAAAAKRKMAMIMPGAIQDADFNAVGYVALQEVAKAYDLQVSHSESVAVADAERISREYISAGYDIIAYHGGQYPTIMAKLAAQFPNVNFIQEAFGRLPNLPPNAWNIGRKFQQGFYVLGALAALSTKSNKVGMVAGVRLPDVIASTNAVKLALKDHNPKAQLLWNHIGDFNDPVKARQTTEAQIGNGVDFVVVFVNLGLSGVVEAIKASQKPVLLTTFYTEKWDLAPKNMTVSLLFDFTKPYKEIAGKILKGERTGYYEMRPGSGMELSELRNVSPEVAAKVKAIFKDVVDGKKVVPEVTDKVAD
jgi:basic membrane lipoprotein Med (substrate-binding protein (PBP1-ABC) superfamily)